MKVIQVNHIVVKVRSYLNSEPAEWKIIGPFFIPESELLPIERNVAKNFTYTFHVEVIDVLLYGADNKPIVNDLPLELSKGL